MNMVTTAIVTQPSQGIAQSPLRWGKLEFESA